MSDKISVLVGKSADLRPIYQIVSTDTLPEPYRSAEELREALAGISWKSCEKDNMEFSARITCYQMDAIRALLSRMPK